jgi:hypothetical protein
MMKMSVVSQWMDALTAAAQSSMKNMLKYPITVPWRRNMVTKA